MSYQQDIQKVLATLAREQGHPATFDVTVARHDSFEMKVVMKGPAPRHEQIFDLAGGLTPRVQRSIAVWVASVLPKAGATESVVKAISG